MENVIGILTDARNILKGPTSAQTVAKLLLAATAFFSPGGFSSQLRAEPPSDSATGSLDCGVAVHIVNRPVLNFPRVSRGADTVKIAIAPRNEWSPHETVICAVGHLWFSKGPLPSPPAENDTGECILFINAENGRYARIDYHQPSPQYISVSPNGRYVGFASEAGWAAPPTEPEGDLRLPTKQGTLRYSVWNVNPVKLEWEMRFYPKTAEGGRGARFVRPSEKPAQLAPPRWRSRQNVQLYRDAQIGFSPKSDYFVALDHEHGVHVLRLADGHQVHWAASDPPSRVICYTFADENSDLYVICADRSIRAIDLATGVENRERQKTLHSAAEIARQSNTYFLPQFAANDQTGLMFNRGDGVLNVFSAFGNERLKKTGRDLTSEIKNGGTRNACHLDVSRDGRWFGIGYGYGDRLNDGEFSDGGDYWRYEIASAATGRIRRQVSLRDPDRYRDRDRAFQPVNFDDVPTVFLERVAAMCMSTSGTEIIYALPLRD